MTLFLFACAAIVIVYGAIKLFGWIMENISTLALGCFILVGSYALLHWIGLIPAVTLAF